jgi:hypothetical protein
MTYTTFQDLLTIAAIAPLVIAAALFISHLVNCWQRTKTPQPATDDLTDLLDITASPAPIAPDDCTLPMNPTFLDCFLSSIAAAPPNIPAPKLHLFQETPRGKILGIIWDEENQEWLYRRDGEDLDVRSEGFRGYALTRRVWYVVKLQVILQDFPR